MSWRNVVVAVSLASIALAASACTTCQKHCWKSSSIPPGPSFHPGVVQVQRSSGGSSTTVAFYTFDPLDPHHQYWLSIESLPIGPTLTGTVVHERVASEPDSIAPETLCANYFSQIAPSPDPMVQPKLYDVYESVFETPCGGP